MIMSSLWFPRCVPSSLFLATECAGKMQGLLSCVLMLGALPSVPGDAQDERSVAVAPTNPLAEAFGKFEKLFTGR